MGWKKLSKSVFGYFKTKKNSKKKVPMAIKLEGGGVSLSGPATSGWTFFCSFLNRNVKNVKNIVYKVIGFPRYILLAFYIVNDYKMNNPDVCWE